MEIIKPNEFKLLMDALTTRIKGGDHHECDEMTANMYYQAVGVRVDSADLMEGFNCLYREWSHYRLPSPEEWLKAARPKHSTNSGAYEDYRALEPSDRPQLTAVVQSEVDKAERSKRNRIALLAGIYEDQGDTKFYRSMLQGRSQSWDELIQRLTGHAGAIAHDEVMNQVAANAAQQNRRRVA